LVSNSEGQTVSATAQTSWDIVGEAESFQGEEDEKKSEPCLALSYPRKPVRIFAFEELTECNCPHLLKGFRKEGFKILREVFSLSPSLIV
jgi:hypothetical protein